MDSQVHWPLVVRVGVHLGVLRRDQRPLVRALSVRAEMAVNRRLDHCLVRLPVVGCQPILEVELVLEVLHASARIRPEAGGQRRVLLEGG